MASRKSKGPSQIVYTKKGIGSSTRMFNNCRQNSTTP